MDAMKASIRSTLHSQDSIARERVREWIAGAQDVETLALLYQLTEAAWSRIHPELEMDETCLLIRNYFLRCIRENPRRDDGDDEEDEVVPLSRYEAAGDLEAWFDHLASNEQAKAVLQDVVVAITDLFLNSDEDVRDAIEMGFLEHVLEQAGLRHWFSHWSNDQRLQDAWQRALEWGEAHPDLMKSKRQELRALRLRGE